MDDSDSDDGKIVLQPWWARLEMAIEGDARDCLDKVDEIAEKLWKAGITDERPAVIGGTARPASEEEEGHA